MREEVKSKKLQRIWRHFIFGNVGGGSSMTLLAGCQMSSAFPSDKSIMKISVIEW